MVVTWDFVGYYACHVDKVMAFQLILTDASQCGAPGDFDVEFRYNRCQWTTGDASGGSAGFGGTPAQAGFDAGDNVNFSTVPGSLQPDINQRLCNGSNVGEPGVWHFTIRNGAITADGGVETCGVGACTRIVPRCSNGQAEQCVPGNPSPEVCNSVDDDCNGGIDDGTQTCGVGVCQNTVPLCANGRAVTCTPGPHGPEICDNHLDDDCNGLVDDGCGEDVIVHDASLDVCLDRSCLLLEGRAGPAGNCTCRAAGSRGGTGSQSLGWFAVVTLIATTGRGRRRRPIAER
jgi:hypothetical protein